MSTNGRVRDNEPNVATSFSGLAHDVIELAELQSQLFVHDVKTTARQTRTALLLVVVGACVLLGSSNVLLFAFGDLITKETGWPLAVGHAVAATIGIAVSAAILAIAWYRLSTRMSTMRRSRDELSRNIAWVKSTLRRRAARAPEVERESKSSAPWNPR